jgi:hypothetical protein
VGARRAPPTDPTARGTADEIDGIPGFWCDIDVAGPAHKKKNLVPTIEAAREFVRELFPTLKPSAVVMSGHGLQAYWSFPEFWILDTPEERRKAAAWSERFSATIKAFATVKGYTIDSVFDLSRVLRLAGTINHKGEPVSTRLELPRADGERINAYTLDDFDPCMIAEEFVPTEDGKSKVRFDVGYLILSADRSPPADALAALLTNHEKARLTWEKKREDLPDQSPSCYDFSLAVIAARFKWTDQEIADLLIARRRTAGDDLKTGKKGTIRLDYYQRTIANARKRVAEEVEANPYSEPGDESPLVGADGKPMGDDARAKIFERLSKVFDLPIDKFVQQGEGDDSLFAFVLRDGTLVPIGSARVLDDQKAIRAKVFPIARKFPRRLKPAQWDKMIAELGSVVEVVENVEATRGGKFAAMLTEYLVSKASILRSSAADWTQSIALGDPFVRGGRLYLCTTNVEAWVRFSFTRKVETRDLWVDLPEWGFVNDTEQARVAGRKFSRRYWSAAVDDLAEKNGFVLPLLNDGKPFPAGSANG